MTLGPRHGKPYIGSRRRLQNALVGLGGILALLAGATVLIVALPRAVAEENSFQSATECRGPTTRDCLWAAWFTVESLDIRRGKNAGGRIQLSGSETGAGPVEFSGISEFLERVRPGDRVVGTLWRGEIVVLSDGRGGQRTLAHPTGDSQLMAGLGILLLLGGALGTYAAWWWMRDPDRWARRHPPALVAAGWAAGALAAHTFVLMIVLDGRDASLGLFLTLWAPAAAAAGALLVRRRIASRRTPHHGPTGGK